MAKRVVVVGGGIAGLAVAYELRERAARMPDGLEVCCLEAGAQPGGNIRTFFEDGFVCEWGPNGFLDNAPATLDLVRRVGLEARLLPADRQSEIRWIWRKGKLRRVPGGPGSFLRSDVLSWGGKLRLLGEPFARKRPADVDETVFDFAARRIGVEAARVLVGAMVTGIYAGDAKSLSLRATFPKMHAMETRYGGLFRAMLGKAREARRAGKKRSGGPAGPGGHLTSFQGGLQELPVTVARVLGSAVRLSSPVEALLRGSDSPWQLRLRGEAPIAADAVVLASPAWHAAEIVGALDTPLAASLAEIPSAPLAVLHLGYEEARLPERPVGFGFLVPRGEGPRMLGTLFSSNIFPGRAPAGSFLLTVMIGGAHEPAILAREDTDLVAAVREELRATLRIEGAPTFVRVFRHPRGIPQYTVGHDGRLAAIDHHLAQHPGVFVYGNSYRGISVNLCIEQAPAMAERVLCTLGAGPPTPGGRSSAG